MTERYLFLNFLLPALIFITFQSQGQRRIKELEVKESGFESRITYNPIVNTYKTADGLLVTLTPLSADQLNLPFTDKNALDGRFQYTHYQRSIREYFLKRRPRMAQKSDFDFLLEGADWLFDREEISEGEFNSLVSEIFNTYDPANQPLISGRDIITHDNPYFIDGRYLSVFLVEIVNETSEIAKFDETFVLQDKAESLSMLSKEFLIGSLTANKEFTMDKEFILERYHFHGPLTIPPGASVAKYIATLPVESGSESISILATDSKKILTWHAEHDRREISRVLRFYELELDLSNNGLESFGDVAFNIVSDNTGTAFANRRDLCVDIHEIDKPVEVVSLSLNGNKLFFGRQKVIPISFLDFEKKKRSPILLTLTEITGIKRKSPPIR